MGKMKFKNRKMLVSSDKIAYSSIQSSQSAELQSPTEQSITHVLVSPRPS